VFGRRSWGLNALAQYRCQEKNSQYWRDRDPLRRDERIDARTIVYRQPIISWSETVRLRVKAENLFDEPILRARRPYGLAVPKNRANFIPPGSVVDCSRHAHLRALPQLTFTVK